MEQAGQYVLSLVCAGMICGSVLSICGKGPSAGMLRTLCGLVMVFLMLSPLRQLDFHRIYGEIGVFSDAAQEASADGAAQAALEEKRIITEACKSYIMNKAADMGVEIGVEIHLQENTMIPESITVTGALTPYERQALSSYIARTLGIEKEAQDWIP